MALSVEKTLTQTWIQLSENPHINVTPSVKKTVTQTWLKGSTQAKSNAKKEKREEKKKEKEKNQQQKITGKDSIAESRLWRKNLNNENSPIAFNSFLLLYDKNVHIDLSVFNRLLRSLFVLFWLLSNYPFCVVLHCIYHKLLLIYTAVFKGKAFFITCFTQKDQNKNWRVKILLFFLTLLILY